MIQETSLFITVPQVVREKGYENDEDINPKIGAKVRDIYKEKSGHAPVKDNRPKTYDPGSHCFALYPELMRSDIEFLVDIFYKQKARQIDWVRETNTK